MLGKNFLSMKGNIIENCNSRKRETEGTNEIVSHKKFYTRKVSIPSRHSIIPFFFEKYFYNDNIIQYNTIQYNTI